MLDNWKLLSAGLELMRQNGKPLSKLDGFGRSMRYALANGETVRVRTCNDHVLIVLKVGDGATGDEKLNIDETDWLLVVMPERPRTPGKVMAYLVPTAEAHKAAVNAHRKWLAMKPNTKGGNTTRNLWFEEDTTDTEWCGFHKKWSKYRLEGGGSATEVAGLGEAPETGNVIKAEVEAARQRISKAAGVSLDAVKITIQFGM